jgi:hypothetical protein
VSAVGALGSGAFVADIARQKKSPARKQRIVHRSCTGNAEND